MDDILEHTIDPNAIDSSMRISSYNKGSNDREGSEFHLADYAPLKFWYGEAFIIRVVVLDSGEAISFLSRRSVTLRI